MSYESGQVTASISGTVTTTAPLPSIPAGATAFVYTGSQGAGTTTLRTAAAGKRLYVISIQGFHCSTGSGGTSVKMLINAGDTDVLTAVSTAATAGIPVVLTPAIALRSDDTGTLKVYGAANQTLYFCIYGYEV